MPILSNVQPPVTHPDLVKMLMKSGHQMQMEITPSDLEAWHMASCVCSEAGELFDAIKRVVIYRKELDRDNLLEELGDIEFYLEGLRQKMGVTRDESLQSNIAKLSERYHKLTFSNEQAQERADKLNQPISLPGGMVS